MTEAEWLACEDPGKMSVHLWRMGVSDRKVRLHAASCCRRIWRLLADARSRRAIEVAEAHADDEVTEEELETAWNEAHEVWVAERLASGGSIDDFPDIPSLAAFNVIVPPGWWGGAPAFVAPYDTAREVADDGRTEGLAQAGLIRDIFGNPFRPVTCDPAWLSWNGGTIPTLARAVYEERELPSGHLNSVRLALMADMLEDAGCIDTAILEHLRGPGPHVRGCWAVDLVLGKG